MKRNDCLFIIIKRLWKEIGVLKYGFYLILLFSALASLGSLAAIRSLELLTHHILEQNWKGMNLALIYICAGYLVNATFTYFSGYRQDRFREDIILQYRTVSAQRLSKASFIWLEQMRAGDLMQRLSIDIDQAARFIGNSLPQLVLQFLSVFIFAVYISFMHFWIAVIYLPGYVLMIFVQYAFSKPIQRAVLKYRQLYGILGANFQDMINNRVAIKTDNLFSTMDQRLKERIEDTIQQYKKAALLRCIQYLCNVFPYGLQAITVSLTFLVLNDKAITPAAILGFLVISQQMGELAQQIGASLFLLRDQAAGASRVFPVWDCPLEENADEKNIEPIAEAPVLEFRNVTFRYDQSNIVLNNVNFSIKKGETVALVGVSGCGKSTVLKLAAGLYKPTSGSIKICGYDIDSWPQEQLRNYLAMMTQDTFLFTKSIYENIAIGRRIGSAIQKKVEEIARTVGIHTLINTLPDKYWTIIRERGANFSGGQKQLISIARILMRDASLLILDEPTASLDPISEREVQQILDYICRERTCLIVTHCLSTICLANRILVMDNGRIIEEGTHESLIKENGVYALLYRQEAETV